MDSKIVDETKKIIEVADEVVGTVVIKPIATVLRGVVDFFKYGR